MSNADIFAPGARVCVKFSKLLPTNNVRKIRSDHDSREFCEGLEVIGLQDMEYHNEEVLAVTLRHEKFPTLPLWCNLEHIERHHPLQSTGVTEGSVAGSNHRPIPPVPTPQDAQLTGASQPQPAPANLAISANTPTESQPLRGVIAKSKLKLNVGSKVNFRYKNLLPRRLAQETFGSSLFSEGVASDVTVLEILDLEGDGKPQVCAKVLESFYIPLRNCLLPSASCPVKRTVTTREPSPTALDNSSESEAEEDEESDSDILTQNSVRASDGTVVNWMSFGSISINPCHLPKRAAMMLSFARRLEIPIEHEPLHYFLHFLPRRYFETTVLGATNHCGKVLNPHSWRALGMEEFEVYIGCLLIISLHGGNVARSVFWSAAPPLTHEPTVRLNSRMSRARFDQISSALRFNDSNHGNDKFHSVRGLLHAFNEHTITSFKPCWQSCLDESMMQWENLRSASGVVVVPRKPTPIGNEFHTIACATTAILYHIDIVEGKDSTIAREFDDRGKTCGLVLRMTKSAGLWGSGDCLTMDSGFAKVTVLTQLLERGVHAQIYCKPRRYWPMHVDGPLYRQRCEGKALGHCESRFGELQAYRVGEVHHPAQRFFVAAYKDTKHTGVIASTFSTTHPAGRARVRYVGGQKIRFQLPEVFDDYYRARNAVDRNNQLRQGHASLEQEVLSRRWASRVFTFVLGIIETNAFLAFNHFEHSHISHMHFRGLLADALFARYNVSRARIESATATQDHALIPGHRLPSGQRRRLRCAHCPAENALIGRRRTIYHCSCNDAVGICQKHHALHVLYCTTGGTVKE